MKPAFALILALLLCSCASGRAAIEPPPEPPDAPMPRFLVKPRENSDKPDAFHTLKARKVTKLKHGSWQIVEGNKREYRNSGFFDVAEDDILRELVVPAGDPLFAQQWCHQVMQSVSAWDIATSNSVVVAVVDSGINYNHPDLITNLWTGTNGEHGYVSTNGVLQAGGFDDQYHGTMCAGIIGAVGNNGVGVVGVNWRTKLASFKFLTSFGSGATSDALLVLDKMIDLKEAGVNIRVANCSWGGGNYSAPLQDMFAQCEQAGILVVCAAGNSGADSDIVPLYPAALTNDGILSVLSSDQQDAKASYSNFGVVSTDLSAPGTEVISTERETNYTARSGTSLSAPQVTGAAAMLFHLNPNLTPVQVKTLLLHPTTFDRLTFQQSSTGGGRLNLRKLWSSPFIRNPLPANLPPRLALAPSSERFYVLPGQELNLTAIPSDADGSEFFLSSSWTSQPWPPPFNLVAPYTQPFSQSVSNLVFFPANLALDQCLKVSFNVSDGHGGGAVARTSVWRARNESLVSSLVVTNFRGWIAEGRLRYRLDAPLHLRYAVAIYPRAALPTVCCFNSNTDADGGINTLQTPGSYTLRAYGVDEHGNPFVSPPAVIFVSGAITQPPRLVVTTTGPRRRPAPLTVEVSLASTLKNGATSLLYSDGVQFFSTNTTYRRTFTEPGVYPIEYTVYDPSSNTGDIVTEFFTATPGARLDIVALTQTNATFKITGDVGIYALEAKGTNGGFVTQGQPLSHVKTATVTSRPITRQAWEFFRLRLVENPLALLPPPDTSVYSPNYLIDILYPAPGVEFAGYQ